MGVVEGTEMTGVDRRNQLWLTIYTNLETLPLLVCGVDPDDVCL